MLAIKLSVVSNKAESVVSNKAEIVVTVSSVSTKAMHCLQRKRKHLSGRGLVAKNVRTVQIVRRLVCVRGRTCDLQNHSTGRSLKVDTVVWCSVVWCGVV